MILAQVNLANNTPQIRDISDIIISPVGKILIFIIFGLVLLIGITLLFLLIKKIFSRFNKENILLPDEVFFKNIEKIKKQNLIKTDLKTYYLKLSEVIRDYIEKRYHYPALDKTSQELIDDFLAKAEIDESLKEKYIDFIQRSDLIKFADFPAKIDQAEKDESLLVRFVLKTKQIITQVKEK